MKNIVQFNLDNTDNAIIKHNGLIVGNPCVVECQLGKNEFTIENAKVIDIMMYGMGSNHIIKLTQVKEKTTYLEYEYPVFSWLHKILNHGWLLKEDNE